MSTTKELLIKIKDAAKHGALPVNEIPINDIKEAVLAEYGNTLTDITEHEVELTSLYNDIESVDNKETNLNIILQFLDNMISHIIYLEKQNSTTIQTELPDNTSPDDQFIYYLKLADYYSDINKNQCYLCIENAYYHCKDSDIKSELFENMNTYKHDNYLNINKTSIVIVSYNNLYLMQQCIYSIRNTCYYDTYQIVVVDNASTDGVTEWLQQQDDIILIKSPENLGFPKGCNTGIMYSNKSNDIFLLNNDTRLTPNSLFWLRMGLYDSASTGATCAINNYTGLIEHIRLSYDSIDDYQRFGYINNRFRENAFESCTFLSGFAMLIKREALNQTNLLDEELSPGYYDDDDISFQLLNKGFNLKVCHNSFIYHAGSQSFNKLNTDKIHNIYIKNREYLTRKWGFSPEAVRVNLELPNYIKYSSNDTSLNVLEINAHNGVNYAHLRFLYPDMNYIGIEQNSAYLNCTIKDAPIICADYKCFNYNPYKGSIDYVIISHSDLFTEAEKEELKGILCPVLKPEGIIISVNQKNIRD